MPLRTRDALLLTTGLPMSSCQGAQTCFGSAVSIEFRVRDSTDSLLVSPVLGFFGDHLHRVTGLATVAILTLLVGCVVIPYGYDKIEGSDRYIPPATLDRIERERVDRDTVISMLGAPVAENAASRGLGFRRCADWSGKEFPAWSHQNRHCQQIGVWFDEAGRALRTASETRLEDNLPRFDVWLRKPGGSHALW